MISISEFSARFENFEGKRFPCRVVGVRPDGRLIVLAVSDDDKIEAIDVPHVFRYEIQKSERQE